jgi:hypothetical protein
MRIENWPIGIVSFTLEPGDFVRAKSSTPLDQVEISSELLGLIGGARSWSASSTGSGATMETQAGDDPPSNRPKSD